MPKFQPIRFTEFCVDLLLSCGSSFKRRTAISIVGFLAIAFQIAPFDLRCMIHAQESNSAITSDEEQRIAKQLLLEKQESVVEKLVAQHHPNAPQLIRVWIQQLKQLEDPQAAKTREYELIPMIWRLSIAAIRNSETREKVLADLMDMSLATPSQDPNNTSANWDDWQAVILGGAIINGIGLEGQWPKQILEEVVARKPEWSARWQSTLKSAQRMAINESTPIGTRYDAIRVLAMLPAEQAIERIKPFLGKSANEELQMGAVSALSDIEHEMVSSVLLNALADLSPANQQLAKEAMQRSSDRKRCWDIYEADTSGEVYVTKPLTRDHSFTEGIEGPVSDNAGNVYAVNYQEQQTIGKTDRWGASEVFLKLPKTSTGNGIVFDSQGDLLVADYVEHKIWRIDTITRSAELVCHEPTMNQPNDLAVADDGTVFASDPNWGASTGRIWRVDLDGRAEIVADAMGTTNGIEVAPGSRWLYVNESVQRKIWRFEILDDGKLANKKLFKEFPDHGFDGMRCDAEGNLFVTRYGKGTVVVLDPQGNELREIDVLGSRPSNLCFGGEDGKTVVVTEVEHGRLVRFRSQTSGRVASFSAIRKQDDFIKKALRWNQTSYPTKILSDRLEEWKAESTVRRKRFQTLLGPMPPVGLAPLVQVLSSEIVEGVERREIRIEVEPDVFMNAYLLIPQSDIANEVLRDGKRPGIVALHPTTSSNIDEIAGVQADGPRATGLEFAKSGYVVICPRCYLWQDVTQFQEATERHQKRHPQARGIAKMVFDARRALDVLLDLDVVDGTRVGAFGHSLGAKEVLYLMAADPRVLSGVASEGGVSIPSTNWDAPWYLGKPPRLEGEDWDHQELLSLIAPRDLLILGGERGAGAADGSSSLETLAAAEKAWKLYAAPSSGGAKELSENASKPGHLAFWNHGQGHVYQKPQFDATQVWFKRTLLNR